MKAIKTTSLLVSLAISSSVFAADYWADYLASRSPGSDLRDAASHIANDNILPNFSYVGYRFGNEPLPDSSHLGFKVFQVTAYGAIADDNVSDKDAIRRTIAAAETYIDNGGAGAIIEFPRGQFRLNDASDMTGLDMSDTQQGADNRKSFTINVSRGNIVFRGAGPETVLFMERNLELVDPDKDWTTPYLFQISFDKYNPDPNTIDLRKTPIKLANGDKFITTVASDHLRETTRSITVADASKLQTGQWVMLTRLDNTPATVANAVAPYQPEAAWTAITGKGLRSQEYHQITHIQGDTITFAAPIHHDVDSGGLWGLKPAPLLENIGFEDLTFKGNWHDSFVHHKNGVHDGGWSILRLKGVANSWVKNIDFQDVNVGLTFTGSAASTIQDINFIGNPGHLSLDISSSTHVLASRVKDTARHWHAAGFSHRAVGNVLSESWHSPDRFHNLHADQPYANLIDKNIGGWNYGLMGGAANQQPNHLKYLVFWNNENTAPRTVTNWSFMRHDSLYGRVIMPYVVGLSGWTFNTIENQQTYDPSLPANKKQAHIQDTTPIDSLYRAQKQQRLCSQGMTDPDLVGEWPLSGTVEDISCNQQHATSFAANAGTFNGIDERVELGDFDVMNRLEFDIRYDSWNTAKAGFAITKWNYGTNNPYYVQISKTGVLSARVNGKGISATNLGDGNWHHVVVTLNGNQLGLTVDGTDYGVKTVTPPASNDIPLSIGSTERNTYPFQGEIANIKLY
ncbi:hypothetical protein BIT28_13130 [Photobacterium proteolyticum]|uniref:Laminin G domain-containing protein n=1 Tax=Photobacterium proteolyticum TaxID=1903952 RepID=A0A1Q9GK78_9GAMM|nr:DUF4955 domain-containing protein [Photobacterium proteolyticum]OLQ74897.1 hypothetical protein BIT28_13130 [Photobacterium proteolyticum]